MEVYVCVSWSFHDDLIGFRQGPRCFHGTFTDLLYGAFMKLHCASVGSHVTSMDLQCFHTSSMGLRWNFRGII